MAKGVDSMNGKEMVNRTRLKKADQVIINMDNLNRIHDWFEAFKEEVDVSKLVLFPFLEEGVFVLKEIASSNKKKIDAYLHFQYHEGEFDLSLFLKNGEEYISVCGYTFKETGVYSLFEEDEEIQIEVFHVGDKYEEETIMENVTSTLANFAAYMLFVDWINKNSEYITKERKKIQVGHPTKKKKNKSKKKNKAIINNLKTVYKLKTDDKIRESFEEKIKKYNERVISWTVRGHFRRYKNGKVVWVKPHKKGKGELKEKEYSF